MIHDVFEREVHQCVKSSFKDYERNVCWICMESAEEWDLWLSCRHLFCKTCSSEMLRRCMPCPLCRVASPTVLRGSQTLQTPSVKAHGLGQAAVDIDIAGQAAVERAMSDIRVLDELLDDKSGSPRFMMDGGASPRFMGDDGADMRMHSREGTAGESETLAHMRSREGTPRFMGDAKPAG